jgi:hypothetical protein
MDPVPEATPMNPRFAVTAAGDEVPTAVFITFEDAFTWGTMRFGPEAFRVDEMLVEGFAPRRTQPRES